MATDNTTVVTQLFEAIQYRAPDTADLTTYVTLLNAGSITVADVQNDIENAAYTQQYVNPVIREYQAAFDRIPDQAGVAYWVGQVAANPAALATLSITFANSPEFASLYNGASANTIGTLPLVTALYENVLGRVPDQAGLNYWVAQNDTAAQLLQAFSQSAEFISDTNAAIAAFQNAEAAGTPPAPTGSLFSLPVTSFVLTTGVDNVSGVQNVTGSLTPFIDDGKGPTLNVGDSVTNVTNLTIVDQNSLDAADVVPAGVTLQNIQNIILDTAGNAGQGTGTPFTTVGINGVDTVTVNSSGNGNDLVGASSDATIAVNHNSLQGTVFTSGGSTVTVVTNGTAAAGGLGVVVGSLTAGPVIPPAGSLPTGAVSVTDNATGASGVEVLGGTTVNVNITTPTNTGAVNIGNTLTDTGNSHFGGATNPTGDVTVNDAGTGSAVTVFGGDDITINSAGDFGTAGRVDAGDVTVGDATAALASNEATGAVVVTVNAESTFTGTTVGNNATSNVSVFGGTSVNVTTNDGGVTVGTFTAVPGTLTTGDVTIVDTANDAQNLAAVGGKKATPGNAGAVSVYGGADVSIQVADTTVIVGGATTTKALPTGTVSVTETQSTTQQDMTNLGPHSVTINGGDGVTVSAEGQNVSVGAPFGTSGAQVVTQAGVLTGAGLGQNQGAVTVDGGTTVTVNTTGGSVAVGAVLGVGVPAAGVTGLPTGAVNITDTFGSGNATADNISVLGGTTVTIAVSSADNGSITVGKNYGLNAAGTGLANAAVAPTGAVSITNDQVNGATTTYGTGATNVFTDGSTSVTIVGGAVQTVEDLNTQLATAGAGAGAAVGASALTTVSITGDTSGGTLVQSDALTNLTILNSTVGTVLTVNDNTKGAALALEVGGDGVLNVTDVNAGTVTLTDNGTAGTKGSSISLDLVSATGLTVATSAAQTLNLAGDNALTTITAKNSGALNLGDVSGLSSLTSINASGATAGVSVILNTATTSFTGAGGSAADTVTIGSNTLGAGVTLSGSAGSTLVANYVAGAVNGSGVETDTSLGGNAKISGFTTLALGPNASSDTSGLVYQPNVTAVQETYSVTITGTYATGDTVTETVNGTAYKYTVVAGDTDATIAKGLAGVIISTGTPAGASLAYASGSTTVTLTGSGGTSFSGGAEPTFATSGAGTDTVAYTAPVAAVTGEGYYDATGFSTVSVGATAGDVTFLNVGAGTVLDVTATQNGGPNDIINDIQTSASTTLDLTVGGAAAITTVISAPNLPAIDIDSVGAGLNTVTIGDTAATSVTITGAQAITLTAETNALAAEVNSSISSINASAATGAVDVSHVPVATTGATIVGGAGLLTADGAAGTTGVAVDTITAGSGGGVITVGNGGAWSPTATVSVPANGATPATVYYGAYGPGSETINLTASTVSDTLKIGDNTVATFNSVAGGVTGFHAVASTKADQLNYTAAAEKTVIANVPSTGAGSNASISTLTNAGAMAGVLDPTGALAAELADFHYTSSNGVITFTGNGTDQVPSTVSQLIDAAEIIVSQGSNQIASFVADGNTYVVSSDNADTLFNTTVVSTTPPPVPGTVGSSNGSSVIELIGEGTDTGFSSSDTFFGGLTSGLGALNSIRANVAQHDAVGVAATLVASGSIGSASVTFNDTGYSFMTLEAGVDMGTVTTTVNNLAAASEIWLDSNATNIVTSQQGAAGSDSLVVDFFGIGTPVSVSSLTVTNDWAVNLVSDFGGTVGALIDASNSLTTVLITGGSDFDLQSVTGTALTTIDASGFTGGTLTLGDGAALSQAGLTVLLSPNTNSTVDISGVGDHITQTTTAGVAGSGVETINASAGSTGDFITLTSTNNGNTVNALGANETIDLGNTGSSGGYTVTASGTGDTIVFTATHDTNSFVTVGGGATITFGAGAEQITITNDLTGGTSASYAQTVLNNVHTGVGESLVFNNVGTETTAGSSLANSLVNVSTASSLAQALDLAVAQAAISQDKNPNDAGYAQIAPGHGVVDWFQYAGNTYVVEAVNSTGVASAHTALQASDSVVKIVGLVNLDASNFGGHTLTF